MKKHNRSNFDEITERWRQRSPLRLKTLAYLMPLGIWMYLTRRVFSVDSAAAETATERSMVRIMEFLIGPGTQILIALGLLIILFAIILSLLPEHRLPKFFDARVNIRKYGIRGGTSREKEYLRKKKLQ
jgi:hypothetical protein